MASDPDWRDYAACVGYDTEIWYPTSGDPRSTAVLICQECPVNIPCLADALERGEQHGIWGGFTAEQRRNYARRQVRNGGSPARKRRSH